MSLLRDKLKQLGNFKPILIGGCNKFEFQRYLDSFNYGNLIANENSMSDTEKIDALGNVFSETINLKKMAGNTEILRLIKTMKEKDKATFFPGTFLNDFGGYLLPVMPIISKGKILGCRIKMNTFPIITDYQQLAKNLFGKEYTLKMLKERSNKKKKMFEQLELKANKEGRLLSRSSLKTYDLNGLNVLPIICNELSTALNSYSLKPLDVIVHSSDCLFESDSKMFERYQDEISKLNKRNLVKSPLILMVAENNLNRPYAGMLFYERNKIFEVN